MAFAACACPIFWSPAFTERRKTRSARISSTGVSPGSPMPQPRLKLAVRPAGQLRFSYQAERRVGADGSLDLGFLGPWAPRLHAESARSDTVSLNIELVDAEIRVLSSVAEILGQEYQKYVMGRDAAPDGADKTAISALESCLGSLCNGSSSEPPLVYTAKVLAAIPVIVVTADAHQRRAPRASRSAPARRSSSSARARASGACTKSGRRKSSTWPRCWNRHGPRSIARSPARGSPTPRPGARSWPA